MSSLVVHNYARALVELMKEQDLLEATCHIVENLISYIKAPELNHLLRHPKVPPDEKKAFLQKLVPPETPQEFKNFLNLLVERGREDLLAEILEAFIKLSILEQGYEIVKFISAQPMTEEEKRMSLNELEALWQIKIYPEYRVNPNLLGGIIIQRGDKLYDGSLNGQLSKIKEILINKDGSDAICH